ncbi:MAG: NAD(P)/FAD-dependent oxidoreductase [Nocardioidaceae bacterium]
MTVGQRPEAELSWWLAQALLAGAETAPPLGGSTSCDVCIVGGGYTGLWTAIFLKEKDPAADVVVIEAQGCGSGASGRNGGFVLSWWAKLATLVKLFGAEEGVRLAEASADAVAAIGTFCDANGIDAHYRHKGWLWTATNQAQLGSWEEAVSVAGRHGKQPFQPRSPAQVSREAGSSAHLGGVFEPTAATVQPALLAHGLRRVALERGIRIYEHTPMSAWEEGPRVRVTTPRGVVDAAKVVLATNAWMVREPPVARALVVVTSDMVVTEPIPHLLGATGPREGLAVSDSRMLVNYYRTTRDQRLAFGHGGGSFGFGRRVSARFNGPSTRARAVAEAMRQLYPDISPSLVAASWTGPIDRSISSLPFFGTQGRTGRVLYGVGYSGNGVGPSHLGGKILSSLALDRRDEWTTSRIAQGPVGTYPPEPAKYVGGVTLRAVLARKEKVEDRGRTPGRVIRTAALLAPPGLVPVRRNRKPEAIATDEEKQ